ncbi:MAG: hypothetical protein HBSAPP01_22800 [Candidatus Brocadia sapporoensis]|nr:MAG: hypothetical protein HBSAPP01_22800 [Candidatus Brocadia sapporoensis]
MVLFMLENKATNIPRKYKRYIGVTFDCCHVYTRIYSNKEETAYEGRCPRCLRVIGIKIHKDGVNCKFFSAI